MANKYCNLIGTKKISEDFGNINIGFDKVQQDMDTKGTPADAQAKADAARDAAIAAAAAALTAHKERGADEHPTAKGNAAGFMSAADYTKLNASTPAATPGAIAQRDASGRIKAAAPDAADDVARKAEVDAVQGNLDNHAKNTEVHVTAEDHKKLDGIAEGAEVNQNAFAKINDILAQAKSDELIIKGGVGIKITTNPVTKEVIVTAVGDAAPGAHGLTHTELGADPIPNATETEAGLMSAADKVMVKQQGDTIQLHKKRLDAVDTALEDAPSNQLELKPGLQVVEAIEDSAFCLREIHGRTEIRDKVGIINVTNPHAIVTSGNLLPPFVEWDLRKNDSIISPYKLTKVSTAQYDATVSPKIRVIRGHTYTLSSTRNGRMVLGEYKEDGTVIGYPIAEDKDNNGYFTKTVTIGSDTDYVIVQLSNVADSGTFSFENTMLTPTADPQPFAPQSRSMWAAECQLSANPADGTNADVLHVGNDGLPYVLEKWKKVTLDGSLNWSMGEATFSGGKQVKVAGMATGAVSGSGHAVKFNGKYIPGGSTGLAPDLQAVSVNGNLYISISNVDSGWGDDYTPSDAEIKAYFNGWKMYHVESGDYKSVYNGSGTKRFVSLVDWSTLSQTGITPSDQVVGYTPYRLQYLKAKQTIEPVTNYETGLTLSKGWNIVEVGSGVVIREKANIYESTDSAWINWKPKNPLMFPLKEFVWIYRNGATDIGWTFGDFEAYGKYRAGKLKSLYDPTAVYHVTYTMLDPALVAPISGSIATNLRGTVTDVVQWASDAERRLSVVETKKAEKDAPQWITPTLLNDWKGFSGGKVEYTKDPNGFVHIRGMVSSGVVGKAIFNLPKGYRPNAPVSESSLSFDGAVQVPYRLDINRNGVVSMDGGGNFWVIVSTIFQAEQ
ncbi:hypothetical protein [Paenibacillus alvei]|uniref:hypothetical protein n=1 Tax=Paenibacillus alvei TaxID=44250 RepID=UPI0018CD0EAE|nr:hypothetical protein [Paenibacillus alvei]MBG9737083.1 hypothetical protein [Paenibacillus alvei]MBG9742807.1 hypothetical protein [Paenibacillus alvei]MBG9746176.1 hypothetical protein [Paenibacillus alvei]MCY9579716.1 hypothetical protein [Paenibacillus alvei]MCY9586369.1 hypothetical protein [Paenibacillus alvei]